MEAGPRQRLAALVFGFMPSQLAYVMARLGIADLLAAEPLTVEELSSAADAQPSMMQRLVRGLGSVGLVYMDGDGPVSPTEMGVLLGSTARGSMRDAALHFGGEAFAAWSKLDHTIRIGAAAFEVEFGEPFFTYMERHPEAGAAFDGTMTQLSRGVIKQAVEVYDFASASRILDAGGGRGHFVAAILEAHPKLEGAVFDQPHVSEAAASYLAERGVADRCAAISGSFFEALPAGYDLHILKWILHDWNDDSCLKLLAASRTALTDGGRLLVVERLLPDAIIASPTLHPAIASDLDMLAMFGEASERTMKEYERLLSASGFLVHDVIALASGFSILDCRLQAA